MNSTGQGRSLASTRLITLGTLNLLVVCYVNIVVNFDLEIIYFGQRSVEYQIVCGKMQSFLLRFCMYIHHDNIGHLT